MQVYGIEIRPSKKVNAAAMAARSLDNETLLRLYVTEGRPMAEIAELTGASADRLAARLETLGVEKRNAGYRRVGERPPLTAEFLHHLRVERRLTVPALAELTGYPASRIKDALRRAGLSGYSRGISTMVRLPNGVVREAGPEDRVDVVELTRWHYEEGLSMAAIAERLGTHLRRVPRRFDELGIAEVKHSGRRGASSSGAARLAVLYARPDVAAAIARHDIPRRDQVPSPPTVMTTAVLQDLYLGCRLSAADVGRLCGATSHTVLRYVRGEGFAEHDPLLPRPARRQSEALTQDRLAELAGDGPLDAETVAIQLGWLSPTPIRLLASFRAGGRVVRTLSRIGPESAEGR